MTTLIIGQGPRQSEREIVHHRRISKETYGKVSILKELLLFSPESADKMDYKPPHYPEASRMAYRSTNNTERESLDEMCSVTVFGDFLYVSDRTDYQVCALRGWLFKLSGMA